MDLQTITLANGRAVKPDKLIEYDGVKDLFAIVNGEAYLGTMRPRGNMYNGTIYYTKLKVDEYQLMRWLDNG